MFAIGLAMLNAGLLINDNESATLYDFKNSRFNYQ